MKAWQIGRFGLSHLELVDLPDPEPGPGEVVVRLAATSLNARDLMMVEGRYNPRQPLPLVPCSDGCGVVVACGEGVRRFVVGDRVVPCFAPYWSGGEPDRERLRSTLGGPLQGTLAELVCLPAEGCVHAPAALTDHQAATLPCAGLTAWTALVVDGPLRPGDDVLVIGSGGVSLFALQIAKAAGARVFATTRNATKVARLQELGADHVVDTTLDPNWGATIRAATGGRGVDHVVEVGGAGTLEQSLAATRFGGHIALVGVLAGAALPLRLTDVFMRRIRLHGVLVGDRDGLEALVRATARSLAAPIIDRVFPFREAREAFAHLASGDHLGKVVIGSAS